MYSEDHPQDRREKDAAAQKLRAEAMAGDAGSQQELGDELFRQKRYEEAFEWYSRAARQKWELAYYDMGWSYHYGLGTEVNFKKAIAYYKKYYDFIEDGDTEYQIGRCYELGLNDMRNAEFWYRKAANRDDHTSSLAELALKQMKTVEADKSGPDAWFEKGKNAFWDISEQEFAGTRYLFLGVHHDHYRHLEAMRWWHKAAVHGHAQSQYYLALHAYQRLLNKKTLALRWLIAAAKNGYTQAQTVLISKYAYGEGVKRNAREARKWRKRLLKSLDDNEQTNTVSRNRKWPKRILILAAAIIAIVLVRRMDQMSYRPITEEEAAALAQKIKVTIPDQEIQLIGSDKTQKLKVGASVKMLGVYKHKLNKGHSPRVYWATQEYLIELPDGRRGHGPLMETALGQKTILPSGDTAVIASVKKLNKAPKINASGLESRFPYAYTLKDQQGQYALEDLHIYFPQRVTYLADGLTPDQFTSGEEELTGARKVLKFLAYDIRPVTKKPGYFLFPKYQIWNEYLLKSGFRKWLIFLAYLLEFLFIFRWIPRWIRGRRE